MNMKLFWILAAIVTVGYLIYYGVMIFMDLNHKEESKSGSSETIDTSDINIEPSRVNVDEKGNVKVTKAGEEPEKPKGGGSPEKSGQNEQGNLQGEAEPSPAQKEGEGNEDQENGDKGESQGGDKAEDADETASGGGAGTRITMEMAQNALEKLNQIQPDYQGGFVEDSVFYSQITDINHRNRIKTRTVSTK